MGADKIIFNGSLCDLNSIGVSADGLLTSNYIYQQIHVMDYRALHLPVHIEIAEKSFEALYGRSFDLSVDVLQRDIELLLRSNSYRELSYAVRLYLFSQGYMLSCCKQLLYKGYVLWHSRPDAIVVPYENPFAGHPNASSLISAEFAAEYAKRSGAGIALTENYDHILVGVGDNPLFAVREGVIWTTPLKYGATDSVERRMGIEAAVRAEFDVVQKPLMRSEMPRFEELFAIDSQGVVSIFSCEGTTFFGLAAERISKCRQFDEIED